MNEWKNFATNPAFSYKKYFRFKIHNLKRWQLYTLWICVWIVADIYLGSRLVLFGNFDKTGINHDIHKTWMILKTCTDELSVKKEFYF